MAGFPECKVGRDRARPDRTAFATGPAVPPYRVGTDKTAFLSSEYGKTRCHPLDDNHEWGHPMRIRSLVLLLGALASATSSFAGAVPPRPNILFLLSDDHSYPFLSCYGDTNVRTPNIDRLAAGGMKLHRFFTVAPQCVPSRAGFMTGRSAVAARITRFSSPLARDEIIFPEILRRDGGYFTGVCGRGFHLDGPNEGRTPESAQITRDLGLTTFKDRMDFVDVSPTQAIARVNEFLDKRPANKPFFLWVNFSDPHHPWDAKSDEPDPASLKIPSFWPDTPGMRRQLAAYCGEVNRVDRQVQDVLDALAKRGLAENTLIVFAGDNGMAFPHGKGALHDLGLNVPLVVRWPGVVAPGTESRAILSGEDLGPTLLAAAGLPAPKQMSGVSFLPLLRGDAKPPRKYIFAERGPHGSATVTVNMRSSGFDLGRCVRTDRYKLIYNCTPWIPYGPVDSGGEPGWRDMVAANEAGTLAPALRTRYFTTPRAVYEVYDLEKDPSELTNLSGTPAVAAVERELRLALMEKMIADFDYLPLPAPLAAGDAPAGKKAGKRAAKKAQ
jgi:N-sulfoglucosamine sulfohydrolase